MSFEIRENGRTTRVLSGPITTTCDECGTKSGPFLACVIPVGEENGENVICRTCFLDQPGVIDWLGPISPR